MNHIEFWMPRVCDAVRLAGTPLYAFAEQMLLDSYAEIGQIRSPLKIRHWHSFKTCPVPPVIDVWRRLNEGIEVVSAYELFACLDADVPADQILVNGVAKHTWLKGIDVSDLHIHLDSVEECRHIGALAARRNWGVGIRIRPANERDPDNPSFLGQFGLVREEVPEVVAQLNSLGVHVKSVHFHLRGNVDDFEEYSTSLREIAAICAESRIAPDFVDLGGGLPVRGESIRNTGNPTWTIKLSDFEAILQTIPDMFPSAREIWLENGRFMTARAGVLVMTVNDVKTRNDARYLICDGGRTNNAFVSDWQLHELFTVPERIGKRILTSVCGPTCMAYDWIAREELPVDIQIDDLIVWMNAGAYHIPWETRFSHGLAPVVWFSEVGQPVIARKRESFEHWWGTWGNS